MRMLPVLVLAAGAAGGVFFLRSRGVSLPNVNLPNIPQVTIFNSPNSSAGAVLGAQAPEPVQIQHFADRFAGIGQVVGNIAGTLGVQTVKTGNELIQNVSSTPTSSAEVIDMSSVVKDISGKVESIPGNLVKQAKIEYCRQVLEQATASGQL